MQSKLSQISFKNNYKPYGFLLKNNKTSSKDYFKKILILPLQICVKITSVFCFLEMQNLK